MIGLSREQLRDSVTYQAILREGRQQAMQEYQTQFLRTAVIQAGFERFGPMDARTAEIFFAIDDLDAVCRLHSRFRDVNSWEELLQQDSDPFQIASI